MFPGRRDCAQLGIEHLSLFGPTARGAREESDIDLFFDYGKVGFKWLRVLPAS
jgi:predicted nucleotidyltransferase